MNSDLKAWLIAAVGTGTSFGLAQVNLVLSCLAFLATAVFTVFKCIDWIEARIEKRKPKSDAD